MARKHTDPSDEDWHAALVQTFTLLSTTSASVRILRSIHDRKMGADPSAQEEEPDAVAGLADSVRDLQELLMPLFVAGAVTADSPPGDERVYLVQQYDVLHRAAASASLLHRVHQRLMSLYPRVPDHLLEEVRLLHDDVSRAHAKDEHARADAVNAALARTLSFALRLEQEVDGMRQA